MIEYLFLSVEVYGMDHITRSVVWTVLPFSLVMESVGQPLSEKVNTNN